MDILPCKGSQKITRSSIRIILNTQEKMYITFSYIDLISLFVWWCLAPLSTIFQYIMAVSFISEENHIPVTSHLQTLSHDVVHLALIKIRIHNISGDSH